MMNRITATNTEEVIKEQITKKNLTNESLNTRIFYFAQVISNTDSQNLNRIKCRIPVIDDDYYLGKKKEDGDKTLPWCVPFSNRFLEVPEVNSIVLVAIFDYKVPHFGRIYFDSFSNFSSKDYFEKLKPEDILLSNFDLVEDIYKIKINGKPEKQGEYNSKQNVDYRIGIRGRGKNKLIFDKDSIKLIQNYEEKSSESSIQLTTDINIHSSDNIDIISKKGKVTHYNPVFDDPLFEYLKATSKLLKKIVTLLVTSPAKSASGPCMPGAGSDGLILEMKALSLKFAKFKRDGSSEKISIN